MEQILEISRPTISSIEWALDGVKSYAGAADAIVQENSNDAVQFLFPEKIDETARAFRNQFRGRCLYAVKANPSVAVLRLLWNAGIRQFDVASLREVELLTKELPEAELYFMHPVKSRQAIRFAYESSVRTFAFDSMDELNKIADETDGASNISLLLRLHINSKGAAYDLAGKFGASLMEAPLLLSRARRMAKKLGVCFHVGSQCMEPKAYKKAIAEVATMLSTCGIKLDVLDIGGGFPVPYPGMEPPALSVYMDTIHQAVEHYGFADTELLCEPGRAMVAEGGAVAVRVEMRRGKDLYLNDGTYGALFDAGVPGWTFPLALHTGDKRQASLRQTDYRFFGPTCDSCDQMNGPFFLPDDVKEGDWIIVQHLGAYGGAMQTRFNGFYSETMVAITEQSVLTAGQRPIHLHTA